MMHELIDRDTPKCLYCNSDVDAELQSEWIPQSSLKVDKEKLTCRKCKESFVIHSIQDHYGYTDYIGFTFSCKDYHVFFNYVESYFDISDQKGKYIIAIPFFSVDFSNLEKLHEKLKTYITFS